MAGKKTTTASTGKSIFDIVKGFDKSAEVLGESKSAVIRDYIDTGSYILNAAITGSVFKGIPSGRCTILAGDPGTGKSYLALSICRNAQKMGYTPIYMDSEAAIDLEFVKRLGCDPNNFMIKQVTTISEVSTFMSKTCQTILDMSENDRPKILFVLDSIGNLTSDKEFTDTLEGSGKVDLTKQREVKALFRTNATALGKLGYPFIVCSHVYQELSMYGRKIVSGGCLTPDENIITDDGIKTISNIVVGDLVLTADGSFKEVVKTFVYNKPTIKFIFEDGRTIECSEEHKFLIGSDPNVESNWKMAKDLNENDFVYTLVTG